MTAIILYNLWQVINLALRSEDRSTGDEDEKKGKAYRVALPFMVTIFCTISTTGSDQPALKRR